MPQCAALGQCRTPRLGLNQEENDYCAVCRLSVHRLCAIVMEAFDESSHQPQPVICLSCIPTWREQQPRQPDASTNDANDDDPQEPPPQPPPGHQSHSQGGHPSVLPRNRLQSPYVHGYKSSPLWRFYHIYNKHHAINVETDTAGHACCNLCGRTVKMGITGSTTALRQHLKSHHKPDYALFVSEQQQADPSNNTSMNNDDVDDNNNNNDEVTIDAEYRQKHVSVQPPERLLSPFQGNFHKSSIVWKFFHIFDPKHPDNTNTNTEEEVLGGRACCNLCARPVLVSGGSTTALRNHLRIHHRTLYDALQIADRIRAPSTPTTTAGSANRKRPPKNQNNLPPEQQRAWDMILRSWALWAVQSSSCGSSSRPNVTTWNAMLDPSFAHVLTTMRTQCVKLTEANLMKTSSSTGRATGLRQQLHAAALALRQQLRQSLWPIIQNSNDDPPPTRRVVALSTKHVRIRPLSLLSQQSYAALTAHWIQDDFTLVSIVLEAVALPRDDDAHINSSRVTSTSQKDELLEQRWVSWELDLESQIPLVVTDVPGRRGNNAFQTLLEDMYSNNTHHVESSLDQIVHDVTRIAFQARFFGDLQNKEDSEVLLKARALMQALNTMNPKALQQAQILSSQSSSSSHVHMAAVSTDIFQIQCWWSTYLLTVRLLELRPALGLLVNNGNLPFTMTLSPKEWMVLEDIATVLKPFSHALQSVQGSSGGLGTSDCTGASNKPQQQQQQQQQQQTPPSTVTASLVPHIVYQIRTDLQTLIGAVGMSTTAAATPATMVTMRTTTGSSNPEVVQCATEMLRALEQRVGHIERPLWLSSASSNNNNGPTNTTAVSGGGGAGLDKSFYFAMALDPRFKSLALLDNDESKDMVWQGLEREMCASEMTQRQAAQQQQPLPKEPDGKPAAINKRRKTTAPRVKQEHVPNYFVQHFGQYGQGEDDDTDDNEEEGKGGLAEDMQDDSNDAAIETRVVASLLADDIAAECAQELTAYRHEKGLKVVDRLTAQLSDPLKGWWKDRHESFPILWRLAQIYLAVPALICVPGDENNTIVLPFSDYGDDDNDDSDSPSLADDCLLLKLNAGRAGVDLTQL